MSTALERLQAQIDDLAVRYPDPEAENRPLMRQLLVLGPHMRSSQGVVGKVQPTSKPPGNLQARQLYDHVMGQAAEWVCTLGGERVIVSRCLQTIPVLAARRLDSTDRERASILHGRSGLYAEAGRWHLAVRIFLGYDRPADRYPLAECPYCHFRDRRGGSIRARESVAFCANPDCRDEHDRRHEWNRIVLEQFVRDALTEGL